jgi:tetratricopeptide (TPR) repeat protein
MAEIESYKPGLAKNRGLVEQLKEFQKNPRSLVFVSLAESYRAEGLFNQALEILEEGLAHHPGLASALVCRARCLSETRRFGEALAQLKTVLASNPQNIKAHRLQAEIYVRLGQRKAAIRALTQVVSLYPQDLESVRALEELENLESRQFIPVSRIQAASTDAPPKQVLGRIEDFQVSGMDESLASIGAGPQSPVENFVEPAPPASVRETVSSSVIDSSAEAMEEEAEPTFATRTIAELYLRQGLKPKAIKVLRKMLKLDASNQWARETLQDLESDGIVLASPGPVRPSAAPPRLRREKRARALELLLARVRIQKRA